MGMAASMIEAGAKAYAHASTQLLGFVAHDGAPAAAAAPDALRAAGHDLLANLPVMDAMAEDGNVLDGVRESLAASGERLIEHAGSLRAGAVPVDLEQTLRTAASQAADAASFLGQQALYARTTEGVASETARGLHISLDGIPGIPDARGQQCELRELHVLQDLRSPADAADAVIFAKFGNKAVWDEYARMLGIEFGPEREEQARGLLRTAWDRVVPITEALKLDFPRDRPFVADPTLETLVHQPSSLSYPSGHSATSEAAAVIMSALWPERAAEFATIAERTAKARTVAGVHWPSDVAAGRAIGRRIALEVLAEAGFDVRGIASARG